jgi:hypothetical protein
VNTVSLPTLFENVEQEGLFYEKLCAIMSNRLVNAQIAWTLEYVERVIDFSLASKLKEGKKKGGRERKSF